MFLYAFAWIVSLLVLSAQSTAALLNQRCRETYMVRGGESCVFIWTQSNLSGRQFVDLNPGIDCSDLRPGQMLCISGASPAATPDVRWCTSGPGQNDICRAAVKLLSSGGTSRSWTCEEVGHAPDCMALLEKGVVQLALFDRDAEVPLCPGCQAENWGMCTSSNDGRARHDGVQWGVMGRSDGSWSKASRDRYGLLVTRDACQLRGRGLRKDGLVLCSTLECLEKGRAVALVTKFSLLKGSKCGMEAEQIRVRNQYRLLCRNGTCDRVTRNSRCWRKHETLSTLLVHTNLSTADVSEVSSAIWYSLLPQDIQSLQTESGKCPVLGTNPLSLRRRREQPQDMIVSSIPQESRRDRRLIDAPAVAPAIQPADPPVTVDPPLPSDIVPPPFPSDTVPPPLPSDVAPPPLSSNTVPPPLPSDIVPPPLPSDNVSPPLPSTIAPPPVVGEPPQDTTPSPASSPPPLIIQLPPPEIQPPPDLPPTLSPPDPVALPPETLNTPPPSTPPPNILPPDAPPPSTTPPDIPPPSTPPPDSPPPSTPPPDLPPRSTSPPDSPPPFTLPPDSPPPAIPPPDGPPPSVTPPDAPPPSSPPPDTTPPSSPPVAMPPPTPLPPLLPTPTIPLVPPPDSAKPPVTPEASPPLSPPQEASPPPISPPAVETPPVLRPASPPPGGPQAPLPESPSFLPPQSPPPESPQTPPSGVLPPTSPPAVVVPPSSPPPVTQPPVTVSPPTANSPSLTPPPQDNTPAEPPTTSPTATSPLGLVPTSPGSPAQSPPASPTNPAVSPSGSAPTGLPPELAPPPSLTPDALSPNTSPTATPQSPTTAPAPETNPSPADSPLSPPASPPSPFAPSPVTTTPTTSPASAPAASPNPPFVSPNSPFPGPAASPTGPVVSPAEAPSTISPTSGPIPSPIAPSPSTPVVPPSVNEVPPTFAPEPSLMFPPTAPAPEPVAPPPVIPPATAPAVITSEPVAAPPGQMIVLFSPPPPLKLPPPPPDSRKCPACSDSTALKPLDPACICALPMRAFIQVPEDFNAFLDRVPTFATDVSNVLVLQKQQVIVHGVAVTPNTASPSLDVETWLLPWWDVKGDRLNISETERVRKILESESFALADFPKARFLFALRPGVLPPPPPPLFVPAGSSPIGGGSSPPIDRANDRRTNKAGNFSVTALAVAIALGVAGMGLCLTAGGVIFSRTRRRRRRALLAGSVSSPGGSRASGQGGAGSRGVPVQRAQSVSALSLSSLDSSKTGSARIFTLGELDKATGNFTEENVLGQGGFGKVYKGTLENGREVAVKLLKGEPDSQSDKEFVSEIEVLSRLHHRNLVRLLGMCSDGNTRCLVYELVPNGSLESKLHGPDNETGALNWENRMKIALGSARGLAYLHEGANPRIIHRDFKSSNILLENDCNAKVSDFGLAKAAVEGRTHVSTRVMGTFGYVAPEYAMTGHLLVKSDVYSFGVVLLELLTGRKPVDLSQRPGQENLVTWARPRLSSTDGLIELIDPNLGSCPYDMVHRVAVIAGKCVQPEVSERPFMSDVVQELEQVSQELGLTDTSSNHSNAQISQDFTNYSSLPPSQDLQSYPIPPPPGSAMHSGRQMRLGPSNLSGEQPMYGNTEEMLRRAASNLEASNLGSAIPLRAKSGPVHTFYRGAEYIAAPTAPNDHHKTGPVGPAVTSWATPTRNPSGDGKRQYGLGPASDYSGELEYDARWR